jgi:alkanesulfonate monooxygenase SsuD/methylene tetrahydromethanopterin reductase-like flavin-dependent oxidoreductase (luciferase family)
MSGVLVLPQRQTALVVKQAAKIGLLSGGALPLGVSIRWNHVEYRLWGFPTRSSW